MSETTTMRVPNQLIQRLRKTFPELENEDDSTVLRVATHKLLLEKEAKKS